MTRPINPAVTLAIDSGRKSGFALLGPAFADVRWAGEAREDDAELRLSVAQTALSLARRNALPLVVARERWTAGGPHATPAMFAGLGASWGWWQESIRLAVALDARGPDGPRSRCAVTHVEVYTQTWWAACIGGRKPKRDAALKIVREWARRHFGLDSMPGEDEAVARAISYWAQLSPDVAQELPTAAWLVEGDWLSRDPAKPSAAVRRSRRRSLDDDDNPSS